MQYHLPLAALLTTHPTEILPLFSEAIVEVQRAIIAVPIEGEDVRTIKENCHARVSGVSLKAFKNVSLPRSSDFGTLVSITGTVIRTGSLKLMETQKEVRCKKCKQNFTVKADLELENNPFKMPKKCPFQPCPGWQFIDVENSSVMTNFQEIKIQEQIQSLSMGSIPRSIEVVLMDDLADSCQAGDDVTIVGIPLRKWPQNMFGKRTLRTFLLANHLHVNNEREFNVHITEELTSEFTEFWEQFKECPLQGRDTILHSVCPQVYGMYFVKLAFLMVLIGGNSQTNSSGMKVRGESHLLLVGAPGTGKSQFLKYGARLGQRSVLTSGTGSTSAGLTVTAVKDKGGEWVLEAGALVLADGGVCCIDEFNCIRTHDKATIHEAMEQQTLSVAKAGLVCKLNSRATIIAACNPKGSMDEVDDMSINLGIASPLLSRFDLVLILQDSNDSNWDEQVSSFILSGLIAEDESCWTIEQLKSYIAFVKATISPVLTHEAQLVLVTYYKQQRSSDLRNQARTTIRLLESMVRLTEAHARLMFRPEATVMDAVFTVILVECSMHTSALSGVPSALHSYFPSDPDSWYAEQEYQILSRLGLEHLGSGNIHPQPPSGGQSSSATSPKNPSFVDNNNNITSRIPIDDFTSTDSSILIQDDEDDNNAMNDFPNPNIEQTNIWSIFSQREPEVAGDTVSHIMEDKNPIDHHKARGLEEKIAQQLQERRVNKEQQHKQTTIDWDNYDFTEDISDSELLESSASFQTDELEIDFTVGKKRPPIIIDTSDDEESNPTKSQKTRHEQEIELGFHSSPSSNLIVTSPGANKPANNASQLSATLASLRVLQKPNNTNRRKKFVD